MALELVEKAARVKTRQIKSLRISQSKGTITLQTWSDEEHSIPLTEIEPFTRLGCNSCDDFLGEQADLAVGLLGADEGRSTILVRTEAGEIFLDNALNFGLLQHEGEVDIEALDKARGEKDRRGLAQEYDEFYILMLEALQEPKKRAIVRKHYAKLYGGPASAKKKQERSDVTCGGC
jgi:coenzyme F420 hydrogenase subunit beta